jgi:chitinase
VKKEAIVSLPLTRKFAIGAATTVALTLGALAVPSLAGAATDDPAITSPLYLQNVANGQTIDLAGGGTSDGRAISEYPQNSGQNQQWWFNKENGHYKIKSNVNGAWCLTRERDGDGAKALLKLCGDSNRSDWDFESVGGGRYRLKDPAASLYLNTRDGRPTAGRELVTSPNTGTTAQWYLTDINFRKTPPSGDLRLHDVTFLTAHNAHVNQGDASWLVANQSRGVRSQLDGGVRALMLDTHIYNNQVYLCHTSDSSCGWAPGIHYGTPRRSLQSALEAVVAFLNAPANRNEIVSIFLEDYVAAHDLKAVLDATAGLNDLLFRADAFGVKQNGWPKVSDVIGQNKRLLMFSDRGDRESFGVMAGHDYTVENYWSLGGSGNDIACRSRWDDVPLNREESGFRRLFVMNQFRDIPSTINANADNGSRLRQRVNEICAVAARRKANFVAVDYFELPSNDPPRNVVNELNAR